MDKPTKDIIYNPGGCPKIIGDELFEKVQNRIATGTDSYGSKEYYMLKDKIFYGECNKKMSGQRRRGGRNKELYTGYRCTGRNKDPKCTNSEISTEHIGRL